MIPKIAEEAFCREDFSGSKSRQLNKPDDTDR